MSADLLASLTATLAQLQQQSGVQLASLMRACSTYTPSLRLDHILDADGVVSGADQLNFDLFATWTLLFLLLYVAFALLLRLVPGTGLQKGKLPFIASSRCTCSENKTGGSCKRKQAQRTHEQSEAQAQPRAECGGLRRWRAVAPFDCASLCALSRLSAYCRHNPSASVLIATRHTMLLLTSLSCAQALASFTARWSFLWPCLLFTASHLIGVCSSILVPTAHWSSASSSCRWDTSPQILCTSSSSNPTCSCSSITVRPHEQDAILAAHCAVTSCDSIRAKAMDRLAADHAA